MHLLSTAVERFGCALWRASVLSLLISLAACADREGLGETETPIGDDGGPDGMDPPPWDGGVAQDGSTPAPTPQDSGPSTPAPDASADSGAPVPPMGSSGCGAATWPMNGMQSIDVAGTAGTYIVKAPTGYDAKKPMKLVFAWHGLGGTAEQIATGYGFGGAAAFYGLESRSAGTTLFVAGQGLEAGGGAGWPNTGGRDVAFVRAMLDWLKSNYCVDEARIFSVGMSYGGIMSNTVGCALGDVFRAIAPIAGMGPSQFGGAQCTGQVAAWIAHGNTDTIVQYSAGQASRDHWVAANHCEATTTMVGPDKCVAYAGCDDGHPVHWCEFDGGHTVPMFSGQAIWDFFNKF